MTCSFLCGSEQPCGVTVKERNPFQELWLGCGVQQDARGAGFRRCKHANRRHIPEASGPVDGLTGSSRFCALLRSSKEEANVLNKPNRCPFWKVWQTPQSAPKAPKFKSLSDKDRLGKEETVCATIWLALKGCLNPVSRFHRVPDKVLNSSKLLFLQTKNQNRQSPQQ